MESRKRLKTKRIIEEAMVSLLQEESFDHITTVQLTQKASISRSSFYTHYRDKYDMIERYQQGLFQKLEEIFDKYNKEPHKTITDVFELLDSEPLLAALLSENGTKEIQFFFRNKFQQMIANELQFRILRKELTPTELEYSTVYLTNACFGVTQMWLQRGRKESPQMIASFLLKMFQVSNRG